MTTPPTSSGPPDSPADEATSKPSKVVVGVDGSAGSLAALRWATQEAGLRTCSASAWTRRSTRRSPWQRGATRVSNHMTSVQEVMRLVLTDRAEQGARGGRGDSGGHGLAASARADSEQCRCRMAPWSSYRFPNARPRVDQARRRAQRLVHFTTRRYVAGSPDAAPGRRLDR